MLPFQANPQSLPPRISILQTLDDELILMFSTKAERSTSTSKAMPSWNMLSLLGYSQAATASGCLAYLVGHQLLEIVIEHEPVRHTCWTGLST